MATPQCWYHNLSLACASLCHIYKPTPETYTVKCLEVYNLARVHCGSDNYSASILSNDAKTQAFLSCSYTSEYMIHGVAWPREIVLVITNQLCKVTQSNDTVYFFIQPWTLLSWACSVIVDVFGTHTFQTWREGEYST